MSLFDLKGVLTDEEFRQLPQPLRTKLYARRPRPTWEEIIEVWPDLIPVTPQTFNTLPEGIRRYYQNRRLTELAAICLRNDAVNAKTWSGVPGAKSAFSTRRPPTSARRLRSDSNWRREDTWLTRAG